jgi:hypothetical protein
LDDPVVFPEFVVVEPGALLFAPGAAGPGAIAGGAAPAVPGDVAVPVPLTPEEVPEEPDVPLEAPDDPLEAPPELWAKAGDVAIAVSRQSVVREMRAVGIMP